MKYFILLFAFAVSGMLCHGQSIKLKIANVTDAAGEDVIAFQTSDTATYSSSGGGGSAGVVNFELVKFKKTRGTSTNELFKRSINGVHTAEISFEFLDENAALYYKITLKDVTINHFSYLSPECNNCAKLFHQVWMDYKQIEWFDVATSNTTRYNRATRIFY